MRSSHLLFGLLGLLLLFIQGCGGGDSTNKAFRVRAAKEAELKANLLEIRTALNQFKTDTGGYPMTANLLDLEAPSDADLRLDLAGRRIRQFSQ